MGDRISAPGDRWGTVSDIKSKGTFPYVIRWDNGVEALYKSADFEKYRYSIHPPVTQEALQLCLSSPSGTSAQELVQDFPLQQPNSEGLHSIAYVSATNGTETYLLCGSPVSQLSQTSKLAQPTTVISQLSLPLASHSQSRAKGLEAQTNEIVSQQSSERSPQFDPNTSQLRMFEDFSLVLTSLDAELGTSQESFPSFPSAGTMQNGKWSAQECLVAPSLESDYFWLASPNALSSDTSRAPGQSKLESQLKVLKAIAPGECVNPIFLENAFTIPEGWSDPLESRPATALIADAEKLLVIASIQESPLLPLNESSILTASLKTEEELTPTDKSAIGQAEDSLEKPELTGGDCSKQIGVIDPYTKPVWNDDGSFTLYPKVEGERLKDEDDHWYWRWAYKNLVNGKWRSTTAPINKSSLAIARLLKSKSFPVLTSIEICKLRWSWSKQTGNYLIGEIKPEVCPRLAIISFEDKELFITSSWAELPPLWRQQRREEIEKAIASQKPFSYLKELCV